MSHRRVLGHRATRTSPAPVTDGIDAWLEGKQQHSSWREMCAVLWRAMQLMRRASGGRLTLVMSLQIFGAAMVGVQVLVVKQALEELLSAERGGLDVDRAFVALLAVAAASAAVTAATSASEQFQRLLAEDVQKATWDRVLDVTLAVDLEVYEQPQFFDHLSRIQVSAIQRPLDIARGLAALAGSFCGVVVLLAVLLPIHPLLPPVLVLGCAPVWLAMRTLARREVAFVRAQARHYRDRNYLRTAMLDREQAKEVRAFDLASVLRGKYDAHYARYVNALTALVHQRAKLLVLSSLASSTVLAAALLLLLWLISTGRISFASAAVAALTMKLLTSRLDLLARGVGALNESALFMQDLDRFEGWLPRADAAEKGGGPNATARVSGRQPKTFSEVRLDRVSFSYPGGDKTVLHDVSMHVGRGEIVALVGENGSGKTTLAKLAAGLYRPLQGQVLWSGDDAAQLDRVALRKQVAVIFQDFARWQLSARDNIGFGRADHLGDLEAIVAAARRAGVAEFVEHLPQRWETLLSGQHASGADLSIGQWQRVALARALYRRAPLVVLDEPTSALDPRAESTLFSNMRHLFADHGVLLVSHRFSSVRDVDRIYVLDSGRVVESGSHHELMSEGGLYAELFTLQAAAYSEPGGQSDLIVDGV